MAKTDGYITSKPDGDWRYSNTGQGTRGDIVDIGELTAPGYIRVQRVPAGAIAGAKVDTEGVVSDGPIVTFTGLDSLLTGAAEAVGTKPWIVWAGVSPMSLSEVLIIWNKPIVLLDQAKITGGTGIVGVAGRTMIVQLSTPVSIDGEEQKQIQIAPGAVGQYLDKATENCDPPTNTTINNPSGELTALTTPDNLCGCSEVKVGAGLGNQAGGASANVLNALVFSEQLCQTGDCDPVQVDPALGFIVNNGMKVPARCCHPFMLQQLFVNGTTFTPVACQCLECPVWMACLHIFGSTIPLEVFSMDQLVTIADSALCNFSSLFSGSRIPGALRADANCCGSCQIEIVGNAGPQITIEGEWRGEILGVAGQPVYLSYLNETNCSEAQCQNVISTDSPADTWTDEGIIKPKERVLPVKFFAPIGIKTTNTTIPNFTTATAVLLTTCPKIGLNIATDGTGAPLMNITALNPTTLTAFSEMNIVTACAWIATCPTIVAQSALRMDSEGTDGFLVGGSSVISVAACPSSGAVYLTGYSTGVITLCSGGSTVDITVITALTTTAVGCTSVTAISSLQAVAQQSFKVFDSASPDPGELHLAETDAPTPFTSYNLQTGPPVTAITALNRIPVNVVTDCSGGPSLIPVRVLPDLVFPSWNIVTTNPDIRFPVETTQGCDVEWKFVVHPGTPLEWTSIEIDIIPPCNGFAPLCDSTPQSRRFCLPIISEMPNEEDCANVNLLSAIYTSTSETSDQTCMGYDCSPEGEITPPKGTNIPNEPGGPVACGLLVRRPRRRPFLKCT